MAKRNITLHDKYKSTTALYPKIDAKSLTPTAIEEITKITKVVVEEQVVPNPTPTGTPTELQYITINGVEYYIKEGTLVIANPTLSGTEADLTGIQIGDIKYKISAGGGSGTHLYLHNITFYKTDQETIVGVSIINSVSTAYDNINDIANWLKNNGFTSDNSKTYNCVGSGYYSSALKCYYGCCYILSSSKDSVRTFYYNSAGNGSFNTWNSDTSNLTLTDTVIDLGVASGGGGGTQVQSNWNETDTTSPAYIQNKPTIPTGISSTKELLSSVPSEVQMPSSFNVTLNSMENIDHDIEINGYVSNDAQGTTRICNYFSFKVKATNTQASGAHNLYYSNYVMAFPGDTTILYSNMQVTLYNGTYKLVGNFTKYTGSQNYYVNITSVKEILS